MSGRSWFSMRTMTNGSKSPTAPANTGPEPGESPGAGNVMTLHAASATTIRIIDTRRVRGECGRRIEEIRDTSGGQAPTASPDISPHRDGYRYWLPEWEISSRPRVSCVREIDSDERNRGEVAKSERTETRI